MSLIIEDGSMPEHANSYVSLEDADAYLVQRGLWQATPDEEGDAVIAQKEAALVRAFDALNILVWKGELPSYDRTVAWPRVNVPMPGKSGTFLEDGTIPGAILQAQMELAGLILADEANPLKPLERGGRYSSHSKTESVDVLSQSESVSYANSAPVETYLPSVYGLLRPWLAIVPGQNNGIGWTNCL